VTTVVPRDTTNFIVEADEILPYIKQSSLLYLTNPSNPTGLYMPRQTLQAVVSTCEQCHAYVVVDESCDIPLIEQPSTHMGIGSPGLIRIRGLSKNMLLAGFRAAYIVADEHIIYTLASYAAFSDANAPVVVNEAIRSYVQQPDIASHMIDRVRSMVYETTEVLKQLPRVERVIAPEGCYYIFLKVQYSGGSWRLFHHLLNNGVNVVPGILFGVDDQEGWIRICCARDAETLSAGLHRLKGALTAL
jgi:aspartate aminotransferase